MYKEKQRMGNIFKTSETKGQVWENFLAEVAREKTLQKCRQFHRQKNRKCVGRTTPNIGKHNA